MSNELIINAIQTGCRMALLKDKNLVEFHYDEAGNQFNVGDVYLGTVKKIVPGLNAAFIDIGYKKDAFLHYLDLGPQIKSLNKFVKQSLDKRNTSPKLANFKAEPNIDKLGNTNHVISKNQSLLVQVIKEPISTKGPKLSCEISIAGRYLVLVPFSNIVNISRKISDSNEKNRLIRLITSIKPEGFGVIIRTVSEGKDVAELDKDIKNLVRKWDEGIKTLNNKNTKHRDKIIGEMNRRHSILRDMLNETFDSVVIDDQEIYTDIKRFIRQIAPNQENIVKFYQNKSKIFEQYGIEKQLKALFSRSVRLPGGGYLIIDHPEALHVIDVNSGNKSNREEDQENTALNTNMEAAREVARQLRLRDMGGIIIIDFIDMKKPAHKKNVYDKVKEEMANDRSKFTILPLTKFGLMQITRQRVRQELSVSTKEVCSACNGTGRIASSILVADKLEQELEYLFVKQNEPKLSILLHPYLYAYFSQKFSRKQRAWFLKYHKWVRLIQDSSLGLTEYSFINRMGEQILME